MTARRVSILVGPDETLNEVLGRLGLRSERVEGVQGGLGVKRLLRGSEEVHRGRAGQVWEWLHRTGRIRRPNR